MCQLPQTVDVQFALHHVLGAILTGLVAVAGVRVRGRLVLADMVRGLALRAFVDARVVEDLDLDDVAQRVGVAQCGGVDLRLETLVMAAQGVDDLPDDLVFRTVGQ